MKADFIRAKYQFLAFVNKHKDAEITLEDINKVCRVANYTYNVNINVMALLVGHQTCNSQVTGLSPGWAALHSDLGQATYTCVRLSLSIIIWYRPRGREGNCRLGVCVCVSVCLSRQ